jgi:hypothetical protein
VHAVSLADELDQLDVELRTDGAHGVFAQGEHRVGEHSPPVLGTKTTCGCSRGTLCRARRKVWVVSTRPYGCDVHMRNRYRIEPTPATEPARSVERKPRARKRPKDAPTHVRSWPLRPNNAQCRAVRTRFFTGAKRTTTRVAELHRRLAEHRKTLHGGLANRLFAHGADIACEKLDYGAWQKNFPRSVRDRAPGSLVEMIRRKAASAGGERLYEYNPNTTALSQTCLCGNREKKPLSQRVHRCGCGIREHRDLFSAYLGLHVRRLADGSDRLDLEAANNGWLHRQDIDGCRGPVAASSNRRGRRQPPTRRSAARIKARRKAKAAKRQSGSAQTSTTNRPTALLT